MEQTDLFETVQEVPLRSAYDGRVIYVGKTRVPLETVIDKFHEGATPETIVSKFDALQLADVYLVLGYYLNHREKIDAYMEKVRVERDKMREEIEARSDSAAFKARLLARLPKQE